MTFDDRNLRMASRIGATPVRYPVSFVIAGDSGAWPDPTADGIFTQLVRQIGALEPPPVFFAHLGDFAGPGTHERHDHYLRLVEALPMPNVCIIGSHDLDDSIGPEAWKQIHGPRYFHFAYGHTRFVALDAAPGQVGGSEIEGPNGVEGPDEAALAFLDATLDACVEPHRVLLMHTPPCLNGRLAPHPEWGFNVREQEFLDLIRQHHVKLVCCAHALLFDHHLHDDTHFVISGGGSGICSHLRGICAPGPGHPEDRGGLFHAVHITIADTGAVSGRVLQAFEPPGCGPRIIFGDQDQTALS